jgi:hypothetical protein
MAVLFERLVAHRGAHALLARVLLLLLYIVLLPVISLLSFHTSGHIHSLILQN